MTKQISIKPRLCGLLAVWLALGATCDLLADTVTSPEHSETIARTVAKGLPQAHITHERFGDTIAEKALNNYLSSLDFDHSVFVETDIDLFRDAMSKLDDHLRKGETEFAFKVFDLLKARVSNRVDYVDSLLEKGFDFEKEESHTWKRREAPWPASNSDWDELWRKKVKHEYLNHLVSRTLAEEKENSESPEVEKEASAESSEDGKSGPDTKDAVAEALDLSPEELIKKRYYQYMTILNGHDSEWVLQLYLDAFAKA